MRWRVPSLEAWTLLVSLSLCLDGSHLFFRHQLGCSFLGEDFHELRVPQTLCLLHGSCFNRSYIWKQIGRVVCLIPAPPAELGVPRGGEIVILLLLFFSFVSSVPGTRLSTNLCGRREGHRADTLSDFLNESGVVEVLLNLCR